MRKIQLGLLAGAALGLCLMGSGASALPAVDGSGKAYSQTVTDKSVTTPVRFAGRGGRVGFGRGIGFRGRGVGFGRGFGFRGRRIGFGRGIGWRRGWGYGWGAPVGLGLGYGATGVGYGGYGGGCCGCGC